jgi:GAF domain-containing protein
MQVSPDRFERERLAALDRYDILDTAPDRAFDRITGLVRKVFDVPISTVTFVDGHRQWFKSRQGVAEQETCKSHSFCNLAIRQDAPLVVPDTLLDDRFKGNALVLGAPHIRFYAWSPTPYSGRLWLRRSVCDRHQTTLLRPEIA